MTLQNFLQNKLQRSMIEYRVANSTRNFAKLSFFDVTKLMLEHRGAYLAGNFAKVYPFAMSQNFDTYKDGVKRIKFISGARFKAYLDCLNFLQRSYKFFFNFLQRPQFYDDFLISDLGSSCTLVTLLVP